jgi:hypothetical protein
MNVTEELCSHQKKSEAEGSENKKKAGAMRLQTVLTEDNVAKSYTAIVPWYLS